MTRALEMAKAFESRWKGGLADAATKIGADGLGAAIEAYEAIDDLVGKIGSFAGLTYFSDTSNPTNGKLYGDVQSKLTDLSAHLLFFPLELNRVDDALIDSALKADEKAGHYAPWILDLRKDKPHQLDDRLEQLFLEKSMTSAAAFNRLFDETMTDLRFEVDGEMLPLERTLNLLQEPEEAVRAKAAAALSATFKANLRVFTLITNTLAKDKDIADRWRGFADIADSRHLANRVEREVSMRWQQPSGRLSAPLTSLLRDEGEMARHGADEFLGPQRAAARNPEGADPLGDGPPDGALRLWPVRARDGRHRPPLL